MELAWHGGPSFSLRLSGREILIDPAFSRVGDYPDWFGEPCVNRASPAVHQYLAEHDPDYLFITHGHFDHFDLETVRRINEACPRLTIIGSQAVIKACRELLGLPGTRLIAAPEPQGEACWLKLAAGLRVRPVPGPHWHTGAAGDEIAAKLAGRPERYGAMPCGGPMLGFLFEAASGEGRSHTIYVSGDTDPGGFPPGPFSVAVVACGGMLMNPATRQAEGPWIDETTLADAACTTLRPEVLIPVHYDHPVFLTPFDPARLGGLLAAFPRAPRLLVPPYGQWVALTASPGR